MTERHYVDKATLTCITCGAPAVITSRRTMSLQCSFAQRRGMDAWREKNRQKILEMHPELANLRPYERIRPPTVAQSSDGNGAIQRDRSGNIISVNFEKLTPEQLDAYWTEMRAREAQEDAT